MADRFSKTRLIPAIILAIFVYGMIAALAGTIVPELARRFELTPEQMGNVFLAQAIGMILASVSAGPLVDNKGKKTGLVLALGLIAISLFALPGSSGYAATMAYMLLLGIGGGILVTAANTLVSDIGEERRASTLNLLNLFFGLGGLATPFLGARLLAGNTVNLCYLIAVLTAVTLAVHAATPMPAPTGERGFRPSEAGQLLGRPALWLLSLFLFLYVACEVGVWNWLAKHLMAQGIPEQRALTILSLGFALGLLVGRVAIAPVLLRISALTVTLGSSVLMAVTTWAMLQSDDPFIAGALVFGAGLAMAPVFPTTLAMVGDAFPRMTATAMGIVITSGWVGLAVSSAAIGGIAGDDPNRIRTGLLVLPAASLVMIAINLALRPMLSRPQSTPAVARKA